MSLRWIPLLALLLALVPGAADGAVLIEARKQGEPVRIVVDAGRQRALVATARGRGLIDLERAELYVRGSGGEVRTIRLDEAGGFNGYRVAPWGPGPVLVGHATIYHVITYGEQICAEMLVSGWMEPFIEPVVRAIDALDGTNGPGGGCARIPFAVYAATGWPMLAGKIDHLTFETKAIRFDYRPGPDELDLPGRGFLGEIREAILPRD